MDGQEKTSISMEEKLPDYEKYEERLRSFNEKPWPADSVFYIKDLVEAGFVYTGERDLVFCFKCGVMESNWEDHEIPRDRHFLSNKYCPFLAKFNRDVDLDNSKAIKSIEDFEREGFLYDWIPERGLVQRRSDLPLPVSTTTESSANTELKSVDALAEKMDDICINLRLANEKMRYEQKRFQSFSLCDPYNKHWPSAERLASAGFYFMDKKVGMKCFCCDVTIEKWECAEQCPMTKHRALSSKCRFVIGSFCGNIPVGQESVHVGVPIAQQKPTQPPRTSAPGSHFVHGKLQHEVQRPCNGSYNLNPREHVPNRTPNRYDSFDEPSFMISVPPVGEVNGMKRDNRIQPEHLPQYQSTLPHHQPSLNVGHPSLYKGTPTMTHHQNDMTCPSNGLTKYYQESQRLKTFFTWPKESLISGIALAKAGFFYTNKNDVVECCMCSLTVGDWMPGDDPMRIHLQRRRNCPFLMNSNKALQHRHPAPQNMYNRLNQQINKNHQKQQSPENQHQHFAINTPRIKHLPLNGISQQGFMNPNHQRYPHTSPSPQSPTFNTHQYQMSYQTPFSPHLSYSHVHNKPIQYERNYDNTIPTLSTRHPQNQQKILDPTPGGQEIRLPPNTDEILQIHKANQERARIAYEEAQKEKHNSNRNLCKICQDNTVTITLVPCGHLVLCESCALGMFMCPVCRTEITKTIRTFFDGN